MSSGEETLRFDVYGHAVGVVGDWAEVLEAIRLDFAWFESDATDGPPAVELVVRRGAPRFDDFGNLRASFVTPRNVVYNDGRRTIVDYFGRALSIVEPTGRVRIEGEDASLVHEAAYHLLVSRIGEHLERNGLVRLHALGLVAGGGAVALLLPSGGGKSTLALRALQEEQLRLASEDTPLIDRRGWLHPFPLRIGINEGDAAELPPGRVRRLERMEFHPKLALEIDAFADQIARDPAPLRHLVIGQRTLGRDARLVQAQRASAITTLFREAVVGVGVYQGMEFVLQRGLRDVLGKSGTALLRSRCCAAALRRAHVWHLDVGRDRERNWDALRPLLQG